VPANGDVLFDRICRENGIRHILTAPGAPTTTGKVEWWHKTLRREFLIGRVCEPFKDAQARLDAWLRTYNLECRHQRIGDVVPRELFRLADGDHAPESAVSGSAETPSTTHKVGRTGKVSFTCGLFKVGARLDG